jgi:SAM-dependent methyltransferase
MNPRHENWFANDAFWEATYSFMFPETRFVAAAAQVSKIEALTGLSTGDVLDLACGPGRFAVPLAQAGYVVTGVDRSPFLLQKARDLAAREGVSVEWVEQDMREFRRPRAFDAILNLFTSFGYFDAAADNERVIENIYASLKPAGVFVLDHLGKEVLAARFQPTHSEALSDGTLLIQRVSVIDDWSRIDGEWTVLAGDCATRFYNRHWLYSAHEIRNLLTKVGFEEISFYGSLDQSSYGPDADRLVAVARKPAA